MNNIIVCSTARLARSLLLVLQSQQVQSGATQWHAPTILTLADWLQELIESALLMGELDPADTPLAVLSPTQEGLLWEQSIAVALKANEAADLFDTSGLASAAMEANRLLIEWNLSLNMAQATEETQQFVAWRQRFQSLCKQANMLESVRYGVWQIDCLQKGVGSLPAKIQLAGFDRIHPQLERLIAVLKARGVEVSEYPLTLEAPQKLEQVLLDNQDAECRAAVAWAQQVLAQHPQAKLAIVVPQLEVLRAKLSGLLDDVFHPQAAAPAFAEMPRCYDFSLGVPLSTLPIIATALDLLRLAWQKRPVQQPDIARLLLTPYWSSSQFERDARATLDARMRQDLPLSFSINRLLSFVQHASEGERALSVTGLADDLRQMLNMAQQYTRQQTPAQWAIVFKQVLQATHWQGDRRLSSHEYQAVQSFERVLQQFASLDALLGKVTANEAIKRLTQLCQAQIFQPENKTRAAIQVMGMLEAAAEPLDAIWVMGMNDHVWPPVARPNALIPAELQRIAGSPNASSEVQTEFAQAVHQRLIKSARHVIFSSAEKECERLLRVSPLIGAIPTKTSETTITATLAEKFAQEAAHDWQWLDDHQAPPVLENEHVSGGTALLKAQAICPAWAFYQYRLGARQLDEPVNGLDVMERGNLVHAVLAKFWLGRNSEDLMLMPIDELRAQLKTIAEQVLAEFNSQKEGTFSEVFITLETERLAKLVLAWLIEVEMLRPQGFEVTACEQEHKVNIEGISVKLVIDRIDTLDDGRLLLMDYKTGRQMDYKNWAQPNITEPQLPIYAAFVLQDADIGAVCFAKIRTADHAFVGVAAAADLVQGAVVFDDKRGRKVFDETLFPDWPSVIGHWQSRIAETAKALKAGDAAVTFENEKQLEFCEVLPLLRLPERQLQFEHKAKLGGAA